MPLFDFFKKSNSQEPGNGQSTKATKDWAENPLSSPEQNKKRYEAATDFLKMFQEKTPLLNGRPHAGTVFSIGARLAGTSLFRAINKLDFEPGTVVLSEEVNQAYPHLLNLFGFYCKQNGVDVRAKPLVQEVPEQDKPLMDLDQIRAEYLKDYRSIMEKHELDDLESARAGMLICAILLQYHCVTNKDIDPYVATGIVASGVVEAAKTTPMSSHSKSSGAVENYNANEKQAAKLIDTIAGSSTSGSGERLVLGEKFTAMKEALDNGGKYILAHPEVESKLQQSGLDPYIIYQRALTQEMESKISQIDFVEVDIDNLAQEWGNKPQDQAPVYVRQLLWLKANAEKYGYQQSGNSWKLKS